METGAGKTFTCVDWILKNAVDKNKKVLWIAHRHLLLEQASESFQTSAFSDILINKSSFKFRIISGKHDRLIHIREDEDILIASKDSLNKNLEKLNNWISEDLVYAKLKVYHLNN